MNNTPIIAATSENVLLDMYVHCALRMLRFFMQTNKTRSDCMYAQSNLSLGMARMSEGMFANVAADLFHL